MNLICSQSISATSLLYHSMIEKQSDHCTILPPTFVNFLLFPKIHDIYGIMSASELGRAKLSHNERRNATTSFACGIMSKDIITPGAIAKWHRSPRDSMGKAHGIMFFDIIPPEVRLSNFIY